MLLRRTPLGTCAYICGSPMVWHDFSWSWGEFRQFNADWFRSGPGYVHYDYELAGAADEARNQLVQRFLGDWLFFTDADHDISADCLIRLLDRAAKHQAGVVVGMYQSRGAPHHPLLYRFDGAAWHQLKEIPKELGPIDAAGAGCMLVQRGVFERIRDDLKEEPFARYNGWGEDFCFYHRLIRLGITAVCDPRVIHPHLRVRAVMPHDLQVAG